MSDHFPGSPRTLRGGLVVLDPTTGAMRRAVGFQFNPETLNRSYQPQLTEAQGSDWTMAARFKGPAVETIKLEASLDATDRLAEGDPQTGRLGIHAQLATLEILMHPTHAQLVEFNALASAGTLEILAPEAPLVVFVWGPQRVVPVKLTELSITEEAFDPFLNPIRAKVSLGLRVLTVADVGFSHRAGSLFMAYLQNRESLSRLVPSTTFAALGIPALP